MLGTLNGEFPAEFGVSEVLQRALLDPTDALIDKAVAELPALATLLRQYQRYRVRAN